MTIHTTSTGQFTPRVQARGERIRGYRTIYTTSTSKGEKDTRLQDNLHHEYTATGQFTPRVQARGERIHGYGTFYTTSTRLQDNLHHEYKQGGERIHGYRTIHTTSTSKGGKDTRIRDNLHHEYKQGVEGYRTTGQFTPRVQARGERIHE